MKAFPLVLACSLALSGNWAWAAPDAGAEVSAGSMISIMEKMVEKGLMSREEADAMIAAARAEREMMTDTLQEIRRQRAALNAEMEELRRERTALESQMASQQVSDEIVRAREVELLRREITEEVKEQLAESKRETADEVRVRYVPDFLVAQIREDVKMELKEEVAQEIVDGVYDEQSLEEGLPIPQIPEWVNKVKISGDIRLRGQYDNLLEGNGQWLDYQKINDKGTNINFVNVNLDDILLNPNNVSRERMRARLRLSVEAPIGYSMKAGARITTGNTSNPVSTNQTLGTGDNRYQLVLDRAYLNYKWLNDREDVTVKLAGGRIKNPWFSTDLLWDSDLGFEGVAGSIALKHSRATSIAGMVLRGYDLKTTFGAFPLEEHGNTSRDKWLFGAQVEGSTRFLNTDKLRLGVAYYEYQKITGIAAPDGNLINRNEQVDASAPLTMQKGNTLFDLYSPNSTGGVDRWDVFGLASDFRIFNATASYELTAFEPTTVWLVADYVKNLAWDENRVAERIGGTNLGTNPLEGDHDTGYMVRLEMGSYNMSRKGEWRAHMGYRYLAPDAVLDAFTDSDFHLGGTNSKGWFLGGKYMFEPDAYLGFRYMSGEQVLLPNDLFGFVEDGDLRVDVIQAEIGGKF